MRWFGPPVALAFVLSTPLTVLRDKHGKVGLLKYTALGCSHPMVNYHDRWGTYLVSQQSGPRELDEWNSPSDLEIRDLHQGLSESEHHSCSRLKAAGTK